MMLNIDLNILIVEDNDNVRTFLTAYFQKRGIVNVFEAPNGKKAWDICAENRINFIISDWNMPEMNGLELLKNLRAIWSGYGNVPFIMITSEREKDRILRAGQAEVDDYLVKPFRTTLLEERFEKVLLHKMQDAYIALIFIDIEKGKFETAREKLYKAYMENNTNVNALCGLIICDTELGKIKNTVNYFSLIKEQEETPLLLYTKAIYHFAKDKKPQALEELKQCVKLDHTFYKAYIKSAELDVSLGKFREAKKTLESIKDIKIPYKHDKDKLKDLELKINSVMWKSPS